MKRLHAALALSLTASTMAIVAAVGGGSSAVAAAEPTVDQMRKAAQGKVSISEESATGRVGFIRAQGKSGDLLPAVEGRSATTADGASAKANRYVQRFAEGFGALSGELKQTAVRANPTGYTVEFTQEHDGIPVFAAEIRAQVDKQGDLTSVNGYAAPVSGVDTTPDLSESEAAAKAIEKARKCRTSTVGAPPPT